MVTFLYSQLHAGMHHTVYCACKGLGICNSKENHCRACGPFQTHHSADQLVTAIQANLKAYQVRCWAVQYTLQHGVQQVFTVTST